MGKSKRVKFSEYESFPNAYSAVESKGQWASLFGNTNPIVLELACGKGDYSLGLARMNPHINYIGIDIKGNRLWRGAKTALEEKLSNVAFLRISIDTITSYFAPNEVSEIWITFPDPQPQKEKKRLSSFRFLNLYRQIAPPTAFVHLKTDSTLFFESTCKQVERDDLKMEEIVRDIYAMNPIPSVLQIKTFYETMWLDMNRTIQYCRFVLGDCVSKPPANKLLKKTHIYKVGDANKHQ
ncbi:MAG: tRNA (guanosine(46)-N7)-methyltransferase TrmB [Bacteroidetes bacterium]|nr:tRNA (guanosine(46)-N7)-methyltransferase TrmB [Bacteroidota bacterium]